MTREQQLDMWLLGHPFHINKNREDGGMCCPDFSCCRSELLAPLEERELFYNVLYSKDDVQHDRMLMMFMNRALTGSKVYITGQQRKDVNDE